MAMELEQEGPQRFFPRADVAVPVPVRTLVVACVAVAALALAGCASNGTPTAGSAAPSLNGSSAAPGAGNAASAPGAPAVAQGPVRHVVSVSFSGQTPAGGCVFSVASQCQFQGGSGFMHPLNWTGDPLRLEGNVTATGSTPSATGMQAILFTGPDGNGGPASGDDAIQSGPSPLHFTMDLTAYKGAQLTLGIYSYEGEGFPLGFAFANLPQDFAVQATLTSQS